MSITMQYFIAIVISLSCVIGCSEPSYSVDPIVFESIGNTSFTAKPTRPSSQTLCEQSILDIKIPITTASNELANQLSKATCEWISNHHITSIDWQADITYLNDEYISYRLSYDAEQAHSARPFSGEIGFIYDREKAQRLDLTQALSVEQLATISHDFCQATNDYTPCNPSELLTNTADLFYLLPTGDVALAYTSNRNGRADWPTVAINQKRQNWPAQPGVSQLVSENLCPAEQSLIWQTRADDLNMLFALCQMSPNTYVLQTMNLTAANNPRITSTLYPAQNIQVTYDDITGDAEWLIASADAMTIHITQTTAWNELTEHDSLVAMQPFSCDITHAGITAVCQPYSIIVNRLNLQTLTRNSLSEEPR